MKLRILLLPLLLAAPLWADEDAAPVFLEATGEAVRPENPFVPRDPRLAPFLEVAFRPTLDTEVPLDLVFMGDDGMRTPLRDRMIPGKPMVLLIMYYRCPTMCSMALNGMIDAFQEISLVPGQDFTVMALSFDPSETHVTAAGKKFSSLEMFGSHDHAENWHFMVGNEPEILALTSAVNFGFRYDPADNQFAHGSGLLILTPDGRLSRFLPGIFYPRRELQLSLVEAGEGRIGTLSDRLALLCFEFNPETGRYGLLIHRIVLVACLITIAAVGWLIYSLMKFEKRHFGSQDPNGQPSAT